MNTGESGGSLVVEMVPVVSMVPLTASTSIIRVCVSSSRGSSGPLGVCDALGGVLGGVVH